MDADMLTKLDYDESSLLNNEFVDESLQPSTSFASSGRLSLSPTEVKMRRTQESRQLASEWILEMTGHYIPHHDDTAFREALADGIVLCQLLNVLKPGTISRVIESTVNSSTGEFRRSLENISNFIIAAKQFTTESFSARDLDGAGERPQVVDCILSLRDWHSSATLHQHPQPSPRYSTGPTHTSPTYENHHHFQQASVSGSTPVPSSYTYRPASADGVTPTSAAAAAAAAAAGTFSGFPSNNSNSINSASHHQQQLHKHHYIPTPSPQVGGSLSFTPQATDVVARHQAHAGETRDGLNYLMKSCTNMLKTRMGLPATPLPPLPQGGTLNNPEIALDAVGPVLETVLANITAEYEKRLLLKDQESKASTGMVEQLRRQVAALQLEVEHWKELADRKAVEASAACAAATEELLLEEKEELDRLRTNEAALRRELHAKEDELSSAVSQAKRKTEDAESELAQLRVEVEEYRGLHSRFRAMQEENRHLYNTVQDLKGSIRVYCRIRPAGLTGDHSTSIVEPGEEGSLAVYSHKHAKWHEYKFDRVFGEDSAQDDVFDETKPLIRSVLDGYNVCIFCYGQTGSGKTHTMSGTNIEEADGRGIYFRSLDDLFQINHDRRVEMQYTIKVQLLEVYNESVRDLLVSEPEARTQKSLQLINTARSGSNVPDATQVQVSSTADVLKVMELGAKNRATAETRMNDRSSRSHQVLTVLVDGVNKLTHARTHGCLHLIDLAGSERVAKSGAEGAQLLEAQHINKSLSALGNVMQALAQKREHVPYRDSKLTQLLQDSLAGQAKSLMFMHIAPEMSSASETLSTLNFGKAVTEITLGAAKKNGESSALIEAKERASRLEREAMKTKLVLEEERQRRKDMQTEVEQLRAQLAAHQRAAQRNSANAYQASPGSSGGSPGLDTIPAFRPSHGSNSTVIGGGLTSQSHGLSRPPQVARLNLAGLTPDTNSQQHQRSKQQLVNGTPNSSARGSKIPLPTPSPLSRSGSLTSRPGLTKPSLFEAGKGGSGGQGLPTSGFMSARASLGSRESTDEAALAAAAFRRTTSVVVSKNGTSTTSTARRWM